MSEMVERVARAICDSDQLTPYDTLDEGWRNIYRREAWVALTALREPTEAMLEAGSHKGDPLIAWQAMVDEALKA
jgi:hypothetical protein